MEFAIQTDELTKGLYRAQGIVEKKTAMPILSNVLFQASRDGKIKISATDLEVGMTGEHPAEVITDGKITVNARHLYDIVRSLPKGTVKIKRLENNWAEIRCAAIEFRILGMPPEDFQNLPDVTNTKLFSVDSAIFKKMIEKTIYAVSSDETRYNLNGSFLERLDTGLFRMVATDGHRLSMIDDKLAINQEKVIFQKGVIIPRKGLLEIKRLLDVEQGSCEIGLDSNNLVFIMNTLTVVMRLLDGQFPEYGHVVPESQKHKILLDRKKMIDSLRRISILSSDRTQALKLHVKKDLLQVTTSNPDLGDAREDIEIDCPGVDLVIGFNARYLIDALIAIEKDQVEFWLDDDLSPGVIKPAGDPSYTCVVMPMRI